MMVTWLHSTTPTSSALPQFLPTKKRYKKNRDIYNQGILRNYVMGKRSKKNFSILQGIKRKAAKERMN